MLVFNAIVVVEALLAAIPAAAVLSLGVATGSPVVAMLGAAVFFGGVAALDLLWRLQLSKEGDAAIRLVLPWRGGHFFFVPGWIGGAVAAALCGAGAIGVVGSGPRAPTSPAEAAFSRAQRELNTADAVAAHGSDAAATAAGVAFAERMDLLTKLAISGDHDHGVDVYVHRAGDAAVFLVEVPDLRKYAPDAKKAAVEMAWSTAQVAARELEPRPSRLVVGVKGLVLYEDVVVGRLVDADAEQDGIVRHGKREDLVPYFAPAEATPTATAAQ